jgi:hypothetical protein
MPAIGITGGISTGMAALFCLAKPVGFFPNSAELRSESGRRRFSRWLLLLVSDLQSAALTASGERKNPKYANNKSTHQKSS